MGVTDQKKVRKGRVRRERIFTVYVDTGERYEPTEKFPEGRKKYKRVVRKLGSVHEVPITRAQNLFEQEQARHKRDKYNQLRDLTP